MSCDESHKGVFSYLDEVIFGKPLGKLRSGAACQENQPVVQGWNVQSYLRLPERGAGLEIESVNGLWFNRS